MSCFTVAMAASVSVRLGNVRHCRLSTCCAGSATQGTRQLQASANGMRGEQARLVFFLVLALRARALQLNLEPINVAQRLAWLQPRVSSLPQRAAAAHKVSRARLAHARLQRRQKLCVVVLLALVCAAHGGRARQLRRRKQPQCRRVAPAGLCAAQARLEFEELELSQKERVQRARLGGQPLICRGAERQEPAARAARSGREA
jgi:hypothetical protein